MTPSGEASLELTLGAEAVRDFAQLSGDHSSLHLDLEFAKRSSLRGNLVHGVLALLFLPGLVARLRNCDQSFRFKTISARFLQPLYVGDKVVIQCSLTTGECDKYSFRILKPGLDEPYTLGELSVDPDCPNWETFECSDSAAKLVPDVFSEEEFFFDGLSKNQEAAFDLEWTRLQQAAFGLFLYRLSGREELKGSTPDAVVGFLSALSVLVGMRLPGRPALFQDFDLSLHPPSSSVLGRIHLASRISVLSAATQTMVQKVKFSKGEEILAEARLSVVVSKKPFSPPPISALASAHSDPFGLRDSVVLVTGSSRGLGATTAKLFAVHGAKVVVNYLHSRAEALSVVSEIERFGGTAVAIQADVSREDQVQSLVSSVIATFGRLDVLINNAAGSFDRAPFLHSSWESFTADLDVTLKGAVLLCQAAIPQFRALTPAGGKIVNVSTVAVEVPPPNHAKYVVAKSALAGLTRALAVEFASDNIQVNMVTPGLMETDLTKAMSPVAFAAAKSAAPMGRLATVEDVANAVLFLSSKLSAYTTGQQVLVTGGAGPYL